jgi:glycerol-3-phosphate acyltransferase PlsX
LKKNKSKLLSGEKNMRIALDAMGSDNAPAVEVQGAVDASLDRNCDIVLVGNEE